ncbi:hypothetical protein ABZV75_19655 [Streptomyces flaveolus]|uniref:hypothetical protein n=1 Tax=Streptomyces flaveolus TaxID=67297 RepID=UPI0033AE9EF1
MLLLGCDTVDFGDAAEEGQPLPGAADDGGGQPWGERADTAGDGQQCEADGEGAGLVIWMVSGGRLDAAVWAITEQASATATAAPARARSALPDSLVT